MTIVTIEKNFCVSIQAGRIDSKTLRIGWMVEVNKSQLSRWTWLPDSVRLRTACATGRHDRFEGGSDWLILRCVRALPQEFSLFLVSRRDLAGPYLDSRAMIIVYSSTLDTVVIFQIYESFLLLQTKTVHTSHCLLFSAFLS